MRALPHPESLADRADVVTATEALVCRAEAMQEWPVTDRAFGIMHGGVAGVVTSIAVRVVLGGLGL